MNGLTPTQLSLLAGAVLLLHLGVILFNVLGLAVIPLGAWRGWRFVRIRWWRALHLLCWGVVALQAVLGQACFLTLWQSELLNRAGEQGSAAPLIERWVNALIYWPLPIWVFAALYLALGLGVLALWWLVPPRRSFPYGAAS